MTKEEQIIKHLRKNPNIVIDTKIKMLYVLIGFNFSKVATLKKICYLINMCNYHYSGCVGINCTHNDDVMYKLFKEK